MNMLINQLHKHNEAVTATQEVRLRLTINRVLEKKQCTFFYSHNASKHQSGTEFIINKKVRHLVIGFMPVNEKILCHHVRGKSFNCNINQCTCSNRKKTEEEKEAFC
jgi:hypothetical protein